MSRLPNKASDLGIRRLSRQLGETAKSLAGLGTASTQNTGTSGATVPLLNGANTWSAGQTFSSAITYGGITQAVVQTGTVTGQLAIWNSTNQRYEPITAAGLTNAADDAAAATAGVPINGVYRNGSVLQIRVV